MTARNNPSPPRKAKRHQTRAKLVHGIGTNDADYPVCLNEVVDGRIVNVWRCPFYQTWKHMLARCNEASLNYGKPTYKDCAVTPEWRLFSVFRAWMQEQDWSGNQLDKDILQPGNRVYSPATCLFVSAQVNKFVLDSGASRGTLPIGVSWHKRTRKFAARCCSPFSKKQEHIGYFMHPDEAHSAWAARKLEHAIALAGVQADARVAAALVSRYTATCELTPMGR